MGEGYIQTFVRNVQFIIITWFVGFGLLIITINWVTRTFLTDEVIIINGILAFTTLIWAFIFGRIVTKTITKPMRYIAQAILHISPAENLVAAPNMEELRLGRELATTLARQVYDYATSSQASNSQADTIPAGLFDQLPVAVIGLDEANNIVMANQIASSTSKTEKLAGQKLSDVLIFTFQEEASIYDWLKTVSESSLNEVKSWEKVELKSINNEQLGYFDIAVSFHKHSASGVETIIALYDHSEAYTNEETSVSFIALAVHELRTPLTILRGYIEAFDEELSDTASPEIKDYIHKMNASAEGLTTFVSKILNVARINQNQLSLKLNEDSWNTVLPQIVDGLRNRATVSGKQIELRMQPGLPTVAIDRMTISEVITNLIDNAIKYSPDAAKDIIITCKLNMQGLVETTVEDHGVGIPETVMPHLFSKFSRNHRNQSQIGGTGLGLFLSKSIVTAHSGNIWASSKENVGSTFGFTLVPYSQLAKDLQSNNNENIVRSSHGWIKNHSMQRR